MLRDGHCFRDLSMKPALTRALLQILRSKAASSAVSGMVAAGVGVSLVPEMAIDRNVGCRYVRHQ